MPKGDQNGSEKKLADGRTMIRKRYIDKKGRRAEKKWIVAGGPKAVAKARREMDEAIAAELNGTAIAGEIKFRDLYLHCLPETDEDTGKLKECPICKKAHAGEIIPAVMHGKEKIAGLRSFDAVVSHLSAIKKYFGDFNISAITYKDLIDFMRERLTEEKRGGGDLSKTTAHRELAALRKVLNIAIRHRPEIWLTRNPFKDGEPIIRPSLEKKRARTITRGEEVRIFKATGKARSKELAFGITMALETGMRRGEQLALTLGDLDLPGRILWATSYKGNQPVRRPVPITGALNQALTAYLETRPRGEDRLFTIDPRRGFENLRTRAGIADLHWHDLRHTAITRMVHVFKLQPIEVMKIVGHTNWKTFFETYVNVGEDIARNLGAGIDAARAAMLAAEAKAERSTGPVIDAEGVN